MQMDGYMKDWKLSHMEPSEIFDSLGMDLLSLLIKLDEKVGKLSREMRQPASRFMRWLNGIKGMACAIIFHGGELASEELGPLKAILVAEKPADAWVLRIAQAKSDMPLLDTEVEGIDGLQALAYKPYGREQGRVLRSLLASELLVLWAGERGRLVAAIEGAKAIFEKRPVADLAELLARDVKRMAITDVSDFDEIDFAGGRKRCIKKLDERDFERIAIRAMEMRRVPEGFRTHLLKEARKAAGK